MALPRRGKRISEGGGWKSIFDTELGKEIQVFEPPKQQQQGLPGGGVDRGEGVEPPPVGGMSTEQLQAFLASQGIRGFPGMPGGGAAPVVTEVGRKVTDVTGGARAGAATGTTTATEQPKPTFPSFNEWLASFGGQNKTAPATDAPGVKQTITNSLAQLQEAMKGLETGFIDNKTLLMYRDIVSNPPQLQRGKYAMLNKRIIPATETIPQGFNPTTGQFTPGIPGIGAHVEYFLVDNGTELTDAASMQEAAALGTRFEFESEQSMAFGPLLAQLEANNAQGALEVAKSVIMPYMQHVFNLQLQKEQERAALEGIYAQGALTEAQQRAQFGFAAGESEKARALQVELQKLDQQFQSGQLNQQQLFARREAALARAQETAERTGSQSFTSSENELSRQLQKDLAASEQTFQRGMEEQRQRFQLQQSDLDRQLRQRQLELETGFRYDDVEGRVTARKEMQRLEQERFKLDQQRGTLEILALIGQFPQFRNLLNTPEMTKQFAAMGVDISVMFNKSGPVAADLPSAQEFARLTPTKQQEALNNLAAKYSVAPEMILAEIQKGTPGGGGGRITR